MWLHWVFVAVWASSDCGKWGLKKKIFKKIFPVDDGGRVAGPMETLDHIDQFLESDPGNL